MKGENHLISWITQNKRTTAAGIVPAIRALLGCAAVRVSFIEEEKLPAVSGDAIVLDGAAFATLDALLAELSVQLPERAVSAVFISGLGTFRINPTTPAKRQARLAGRICLVTGAAQGFGEGIARELAAAGGVLVIADLNEPAALQVADDLNREHGEGTAFSVRVDVGNEASVQQMVETVVLSLGGIDLLISNAGVLRAGGLEEMSLETFEFVTRINYTAFFLVSKYGSVPMKLQTRFAPDCTTDIIQINSKSGLEGSNRNFAYAGSKFGGIGLVQSFAKELVADRIKVNAICPGNYYEGPLWSDPEKGLFIQYLKAGKVPGAKSVEDVYNFYVDKVPMRRGYSPVDVTRAILYCVEQTYETGQAMPVTGGQNMLK
ncbi:MAG: SDR family NAD(P)-dependent oxidoreductase [Ruminococcaceae bacterium]|nr:SDR family NAD(P)-dependent oxidoreductase [Oscillospiraceae bacterium]